MYRLRNIEFDSDRELRVRLYRLARVVDRVCYFCFVTCLAHGPYYSAQAIHGERYGPAADSRDWVPIPHAANRAGDRYGLH